MKNRLKTMCAVLLMLIGMSFSAQATQVSFDFNPVEFFNYQNTSTFSTDGGMFKLHKTWGGDMYRSWEPTQTGMVENFVDGLGENEGIATFNIWLANHANAPVWGETLVSSGGVMPTGWAPEGWIAKVVGNPWSAGADGFWIVEWSTTDPSKYIRPGNDVGEFGFTFSPTTNVNFGQNYTIWFGGANYQSSDTAMVFDTFDGGFASIFNSGYGSGFEATLSLTANPVPEPATMLLFGLGLLGVAGIGRRKK